MKNKEDRHPGLDPGAICHLQAVERWPLFNGSRLKAGMTF
jgi:hypothetical protein